MFYVKVHEASGEVLVAGCDREILGSVLTEGDLEVRVNERFYGGEESDEENFLRRIEDATIVNIMGNRIVELAIKKNLVSEKNVRKIGGVKHAQIVWIPNRKTG